MRARAHAPGRVDDRDRGQTHRYADYRVHGDAAAAQAWLDPIAEHLADAALGHVSEIFDGNAPHPRGASAQAWSVACVLEAWWRLERARLETAARLDKERRRDN